MTETGVAFAPRRHGLADGAVRPLSADEAADLGTYCADIDPYRRLGLGAQGLTAYLQRPDPSLFRFAIEIEGAAMGVLAVRSPWLRGPFLEMLALKSDVRGRGLGRGVVDWIADQACLRSTNLWTTVSDFNETALAFYKRAGFTEISPLPGLICDDSSEILLRRRLAPR